MDFPMNKFKATDAFEYVDAYRWGVAHGVDEVHARLRALNDRIEKNLKTEESLLRDHSVQAGQVGGLRPGELTVFTATNVPSYLLAAFRGYEHALMMLEHHIPPIIVKLDDRDPS